MGLYVGRVDASIVNQTRSQIIWSLSWSSLHTYLQDSIVVSSTLNPRCLTKVNARLVMETRLEVVPVNLD